MSRQTHPERAELELDKRSAHAVAVGPSQAPAGEGRQVQLRLAGSLACCVLGPKSQTLPCWSCLFTVGSLAWARWGGSPPCPRAALPSGPWVWSLLQTQPQRRWLFGITLLRRAPVGWVVCGGRAVRHGAKSLGQRAVPGRGAPAKASRHLVHHVACLPHGLTS